MKEPSGLIAEFETVEELVSGIEELRGLGYRALDAHMPFAADAVIEALALPRSKVPLLVLIGGLIGMALGYGIPWITNVVDYPLDVGGRPHDAVPAFIPLVFETGVLVAATFGFFGFLLLCRLPRLWHPIMEVPGFDRATTDRFWLSVSSDDPRFDFEHTIDDLRGLSPLRVARFGAMP